MNNRQRSDEHPAGPASAQHLSDLLDEALDEGFPASDPVAIHVDSADASADDDHGKNPTETPARTALPER